MLKLTKSENKLIIECIDIQKLQEEIEYYDQRGAYQLYVDLMSNLCCNYEYMFDSLDNLGILATGDALYTTDDDSNVIDIYAFVSETIDPLDILLSGELLIFEKI